MQLAVLLLDLFICFPPLALMFGSDSATYCVAVVVVVVTSASVCSIALPACCLAVIETEEGAA